VPRETWLGPLRGDGAAILSGRQPATAAAVPRSHRPADAATIRAARGPLLDIGVHSATHRSLPTLTDSELDYEIVTSRDIVTAATGAAPEFFAYPYGLWDPRVRDRIRAAGYRAALTLDLGLNRRGADPWALRRVNVPAHIPDAAFEAWAAGLYAFPRG
jgi:peptidoglycan/xylan/chitin deacetylase (PgdA/CDA1 family)